MILNSLILGILSSENTKYQKVHLEFTVWAYMCVGLCCGIGTRKVLEDTYFLAFSVLNSERLNTKVLRQNGLY